MREVLTIRRPWLGSCIFSRQKANEPSPEALLKAIVCGSPVVETDVEGIREVVRHGENGYLCGIDSKSLREAIESLMRDEEHRKELSRNARRSVEENFSPKRTVESESRLYRSLFQVHVDHGGGNAGKR